MLNLEEQAYLTAQELSAARLMAFTDHKLPKNCQRISNKKRTLIHILYWSFILLSYCKLCLDAYKLSFKLSVIYTQF